MTRDWDNPRPEKIHRERIHRENFPTHDRTYWTDKNAAGDKETAKFVVIEQYSGGHGYWSALTFKWPEEKGRVETIEELLAQAFKLGERKAKADIRQMLGLK